MRRSQLRVVALLISSGWLVRASDKRTISDTSNIVMEEGREKRETGRTVRYVEFNPPVVRPQRDQVTVQARQNYSLVCEGHRPVMWHLPQTNRESKEVMDRVTVEYSNGRDSAKKYISQLTIRHMVYTDTGFYVCSFNGSTDLRSIDSNAGIQIYVFDEIHLLTQSGFDFQQSVQYKTAEIPCRPTHPNVTVSLSLQGRGPVVVDNNFISFSPKVGFLISPVLPEHNGQYVCLAKFGRQTSEYMVSLNVLMKTSYVPPPHINRTSGNHVTVGESLTLTCSISVNWNVMVHLSWDLPNEDAGQPRLLLPPPVSRNVSIGGSHLKVVEQRLVLHNVDKEDQGNYVCVVTDHSKNKKLKREFVRIYDRDQSFLRVWQDGFSTLHKSSGKDDSVQWVVEIASHPSPRVSWFDPDGVLIPEGENANRRQLVQTVFAKTSRSMLKLDKLRLEDSGVYRVRVENNIEEKWLNFTLIVTDEPKVKTSVLEDTDNGLYQYGGHYTLRCTATGYPPPKITWTFKSCKTYNKCNGPIKNLLSTAEASNGRVQTDSTLMVVASESGVYTCMGCNENCEVSQVKFFVTTLPEGFQITGPTRAIEGDSINLLCAASKYNYTDNSLVWYKQTTSGYKEVTTLWEKQKKLKRHRKKQDKYPVPSIQVLDDLPSKFDVGKMLKFNSVNPSDSGVYVCQAKIKGGLKRRHSLQDRTTIVEKQMELRVQGMKAPKFMDTMNMNGGTMFIKEEGESVEMRCQVEGIPKPTVHWFLDDEAINFEREGNFLTFNDGQSLRIASVVANKNEGKYTCVARSRAGKTQLNQKIVKVEEPSIYKTDMFGSSEIIEDVIDKIVDPGSDMNLTCRATGRPIPQIYWMFNNAPVNLSQIKLVDNNQTLIMKEVGANQEGRWECMASNIGGNVTRYQWVKLSQTNIQSSFYGADIAVPVFIAVGAFLVLALLLVVIVRLCLTKGRWKTPPTPPTPRLTQYELPEDDQDAESCRLTVSRDGSHFSTMTSNGKTVIPNTYSNGQCSGCSGCSGTCHQCTTCHYNNPYSAGLYGCSGGNVGLHGSVGLPYPGNGSMMGTLQSPGNGSMMGTLQRGGGSVMGIRTTNCHTPITHPSPVPSPGSHQAPSDFISYSQNNTLPAAGYMLDTLSRRDQSLRQQCDSVNRGSPLGVGSVEF